VSTFTDLKTEVTRFGGMGDDSLDTASVAAWAKGGLRMIERAAPWPWYETHLSFTLTAGTYRYSLYDIDSSVWRVDTRSFRYGGKTERLQWGTIRGIDAALGPDWRDSSSANTTPEYICRLGVELWVAGKPSASHVASYPTVYGYGWRHDNWDEDADVNGGRLLLPDAWFEVAVECSLAYGYHEEDDPRADTFLTRFRQVHYPEMLQTLDVGANDQMRAPVWADMGYETVDNYGDGYR